VITPTTATPPEENYNDSWEGSGYDSKNNENETLTVTNAYTETQLRVDTSMIFSAAVR